jgi:hypothetical protein
VNWKLDELEILTVWYQDGTQFKEENGYAISDQWYPRVTRILDIKSKPALDHFMKEMESYASAEKVKNKSAEEGSLVHTTLEKLVTGESVEIPAAIKPAVDAFQEFNEGGKIFFHPEFVERQVWSARHRYAGTVDALATVDGKFGVLDIKTSSGFYPEYNLQTAAYLSALQEFEVKRTIGLPSDIETRWILKVDQYRTCRQCRATLREKGGRKKIKNMKSRSNNGTACPDDAHEWAEVKGDVALREFPYYYNDIKAFIAAKTLWEWENGYWLRKIGYN